MGDFLHRPAPLVMLCAGFYAAATVAMKHASVAPATASLLAVALCLIGAVAAELVLLRTQRLGLAYVAILGAETVMILLVSAALGEGLAPREIAGAALVLAGAAVLAV